MTGPKTHQQQRQIIEGRVDTSNADKDYDPRPDLKAAESPGDHRIAPSGHASPPVRAADDPMLRGLNQESRHNKHGGRPEKPET